MQQGLYVWSLEKEALRLCPVKPFFSSDTPIMKTLSERYSALLEKDVFMLQVVKCIYSFFGEHRGNCAVIICHFASTAAG